MSESWQEIWKLRSSLYGFLGNCLLEPTQGSNAILLRSKVWEDFPLEAANEQMKSALEALIQLTADLGAEPEGESMQRVLIEYTELFLGPGKPKAPPWESLYRTSEKVLFGWPTFEVREALAQKGLEIKTKNKQPEDHVGFELMLLAAVSESLQGTTKQKISATLQEQIDFMDKHLLSWIPDLCTDAKLYGSVGFYGAIVELIWGVLLWDRELLAEYISYHPSPTK